MKIFIWWKKIHSVQFHHPRLPWDQETALGWLFTTIFGVISATYYLFGNPAFLTLFISICEFHRAFRSLFRREINKFNEIAQTKPYSQNEVKQTLCEIISLHISVKEWVLITDNSHKSIRSVIHFFFLEFSIKRPKFTVCSLSFNWYLRLWC